MLVCQGGVLEQPDRVVGSVRGNVAHFQHQIDACDAALSRLATLVPPPYDAIEALLLARKAAEEGLDRSRRR